MAARGAEPSCCCAKLGTLRYSHDTLLAHSGSFMMAVFCDVPPLLGVGVGVVHSLCSWHPECEDSSHSGSGVQ